MTFGALEQISRLDQIIDDACTARGHLYENVRKWVDESDDEMTKRLRWNRVRLARREARYRLTGYRNTKKANQYKTLVARVFDFVYDQCHGYFKYAEEPCKGLSFRAIPIKEAAIAAATNGSTRHVRRALNDLDKKYGLIVRLKSSGKETRYAVSLPDTGQFLDQLSTVFDIRSERLLTFLPKAA